MDTKYIEDEELPRQPIVPMAAVACIQSPTSGEAKITQIPKMSSPSQRSPSKLSPWKQKSPEKKLFSQKSPEKKVPKYSSCINCDSSCPNFMKNQQMFMKSGQHVYAENYNAHANDPSPVEMDPTCRDELYDTIYPAPPEQYFGLVAEQMQAQVPPLLKGSNCAVRQKFGEYQMKSEHNVVDNTYGSSESEILDDIYNSKSAQVQQRANLPVRKNLDREPLYSVNNQQHLPQAERLQLEQEFEERLESTTSRYEERIVELHSVIAELRKKIERHHINVIKEEDEEEEEEPSEVANQSIKSNHGGSNLDNQLADQSDFVEEMTDLNAELEGVVNELENAIDERRKNTGVDSSDKVPQCSGQGERGKEVIVEEDDNIEEQALQACRQMDAFNFESPSQSPHTSPLPKDQRVPMFHPPPPPPPNEYPDPAYLQEEINSLRVEVTSLQEQIGRQEAELNMYKVAIDSVREERDRLRSKVIDLQANNDVTASPHGSRTGTPTKLQNSDRSTPNQAAEVFPVAKVAELKKLRTMSSEKPQVLGSELSSTEFSSTKIAEHLAHSFQEMSSFQEVMEAVYSCGSDVAQLKLKEFELEFERQQAKIDNLKSQNDILGLTLEESKSMTDRLSVLIGKYESNHTALQLALSYSEQSLEIYQVLMGLLESHLAMSEPIPAEKTTAMLLTNQKTAHNITHQLLHKLERAFGRLVLEGAESAFLPLSEEQQLKEYINLLQRDRQTMMSTVMELESVHVESRQESKKLGDRMDLENAILMQELMAMKEDKTELKAQNYLLEREKIAYQLQMTSIESQLRANSLHVEHLQSELAELQGQKGEIEPDQSSLLELLPHDPASLRQTLCDSLKKEKKLKTRVQELVATLEKLSRNSELRHQQSAEFINDLKRANSALISAFDKSKKKYQARLKKMETQLQVLNDKIDNQGLGMRQNLVTNSPQPKRPKPNETSL